MERPQRRWCEPEGVWHVGSTRAAPRRHQGSTKAGWGQGGDPGHGRVDAYVRALRSL